MLATTKEQGMITQEHQEQRHFGLREAGLRMLQNAANPDLPHTYEWHVIENILCGADCPDHRLPLNAASAMEELYPLVVTAQKPPEELQIFLQRTPHLKMMVLIKTPESADTLATLAPFTKDYPIPAQGVRYYLCQGRTCAQPVDSISELEILFARYDGT